MEVQFTPDQQDKLSRIAVAQGRAPETLVQEALDRFLSYDDWFSKEVEKGLAAADNGELVEHDDVRRMIENGTRLNDHPLDDVAECLQEMPNRGRRGRMPGKREIEVVGLPFLINYRAGKQAVQVARILHSSQQWP